MRRSLGRVGGASAGTIAIIFGILDVQDKLPPWLLITLGAVAIVGVLVDYTWEHRGGEGDGEIAPQRVRQEQEGGRQSTNNQAGRDVNINRSPGNGQP